MVEYRAEEVITPLPPSRLTSVSLWLSGLLMATDRSLVNVCRMLDKTVDLLVVPFTPVMLVVEHPLQPPIWYPRSPGIVHLPINLIGKYELRPLRL